MLIAFYLGAGAIDRCEEQAEDRAPVCHILCGDGCATAPLPLAPRSPAPAVPHPAPYPSERADHPASLVLEPEETPPRHGLA